MAEVTSSERMIGARLGGQSLEGRKGAALLAEFFGRSQKVG